MTLSRALTLVGCAVFIVAMASLHVLRRDLSPLLRGMSRYAGGDTLLIATIAFLALALAQLAAAAHLWHSARTTSSALLVAAVGIVLVVLTPIGGASPSTTTAAIHTLGGGLFYIAIAWAMAGHTSDGLQRVLTGIYLAAVALFFLAGGGTPVLREVTGLLQRVVIGTAIVWIVRTVVRSHEQSRALQAPT